jgi:hypothetical protein
MILNIYFYQFRMILNLILDMNWLICGKIGLFPKKKQYGLKYIFGKFWIIIKLPVLLFFKKELEYKYLYF